MFNFDEITGFEWDKGNIDKNPGKHGVSNIETEQIFFNEPVLITDDEIHSSALEKRYSALGKTDNDKYLAVIFTLRNNMIRVISARLMSKKERKIYSEKA